MIKAVIFDLDDTLFPEHEFVRSGFKAVSNWVFEKYGWENFLKTAWQLFEAGKRGKIFNDALDILNVEYNSILIGELLEIYREHQPNICLHQDAQWALDYFQASDKQLGIITDGYLITQQNKVKALEIENKLDMLVYSDLYGRENWKPSELPYLKIMELSQLQGCECLYIGDNPRKDFVTANKLNWLTIQICRQDGEYSEVTGENGYEANYRISSLFELNGTFA
jgi:putative hydrolase of the HAD superfamily